MATENKKNMVVQKSSLTDSVITRINELQKTGFTIPKDYSYVNAIKASLLCIESTVDKNKQPALQVCTKNSIATALFKMSVLGLDASKSQCYFLVRGNELQMQESYFGKVLRVKRIFPHFDPLPRVVYKDDVFEYETDVVTGKRKLVKHEQALENLDKDFVGAYMYIPTKDGGQDLYVMTKKMIMTAWSKSSSTTQATHKQFTDKMVGKTIINSACNMIINSTPELNEIVDSGTNDEMHEQEQHEEKQPIVNFEEADVVEDVNEETGEIVNEESAPKEEEKKEEEDLF